MLNLNYHQFETLNRPQLRPHETLRIRSFTCADQVAVQRLYREGLIAGHLDPNDSADDLADVTGSYFRCPQDHFWVAQDGPEVVGMVAISMDNRRQGHIRRLRVAPDHQEDGITAFLLIERAAAHATEQGCLKLVLHTLLDDGRAVALLQELGFRFSRSRDVDGRHLLEFYTNLYRSADRGHLS